ncbi:hypothetical protein BLA29_011989, partial [Euroglyphus maynei]
MINTELKTSKFRLQNECRMRQEIENQKNNFARLLAEMEKNGKQQLEKLIEKNRITRQEEFARHNTIVTDMKNEINKMQIQLMEKEKMLAEMQELRNVKMNQEENLKNLTEKYQAEIGYLKEDHLKMVNENDQLKAQIETLKQSLKMAEENSIP